MNFELTPLNRNLIIGAIVLVVGFVGYFSMYQPKHNELAFDVDRLHSLQQNYADLKRVADQKPQYLALEQQIQTRLSGVELTADNRAYIPSYLKQIEDLAKHDGLSVTSVIPQPLPTPTGSPAAGAPATTVSGNGGPISSAKNAMLGASGQAALTSNTAAAVGEAGPNGQPQNGTPAPTVPGSVSSTTGSNGSPVPGVKSTPSARQNAIVYVNQSFQLVPVNMELAGSFTQLQQFLRDLNKFPKLIGVGSVTLNPAFAAPVGDTPTLHIILPITAYRLNTGQPVAPPPAAVPAAGNGG